MSRNEAIRSTDEELRKADELLRLRGSSLDKVVGRILRAIPEEPLCVCLGRMKFNQDVLDTIENAENHPERLGIISYNSVEECRKAAEGWKDYDD